MKIIEYKDFLIEINEHAIYHDFEFVVKTLDEKNIIGANTRFHKNIEDAENAAMTLINNLLSHNQSLTYI